MTATAVVATKTYAIRQGPRGWERWDNFAGEWQTLKYPYCDHSQDAARRYVAAFYGVRPAQVRIEP